MHVLIATDQSQGDHPGDYCHALQGELVTPVVVECGSPDRCGCGRGFPGLASSRATTTAIIVDRPDLDEVTLRTVIADALEREGWRSLCNDHFEDLVDDHLGEIIDLVTVFPLGAIVRRDGFDYWADLPCGNDTDRRTP